MAHEWARQKARRFGRSRFEYTPLIDEDKDPPLNDVAHPSYLPKKEHLI